MSMQAMKAILQAEQETREQKIEAQNRAAQLVQRARGEGEAALARARQEGAFQEKELLERAEQQGTAERAKIAAETEVQVQTLRQEGEKHLRKAVELVKERVVSS